MARIWMTTTYWTLQEVINYHSGQVDWMNCLAAYPELKNVPQELYNIYGEDFAAWSEDPNMDLSKRALRMRYWLVQRAQELNDKITLFKSGTGSTKTNTSKFNDTPESAGDYSTLEHTTSISSSTDSYKYGDMEKLQAYRNYILDLEEEFRKEFIISEAAI